MLIGTLLLCLPGAQASHEEARLRERAARCGSELTWAADWEAAAARARDEEKLVLVSFQNYPGFELGDLASIGPFMDQDIVALVEARLVPLRLKLGMRAPLTAPEVYGMGPSTFGVALMLASPDGEVLTETFSHDSAVVYEFLRAGLKAHAGALELARADVGKSVLEAQDARASAQRLLVGGELERVESRLADLARLGAERLPHLRADLARLRGDPRAGLTALAELLGDDPERLEREAGFLASLGEYDEAAARLERLATPSASARFLGAMLALARTQRAAGLAELRTLALEEPETRWSWLAAALLTNPALTTRDTWSLVPASTELVREGLAVPTEPLAADEHARARADATAWLSSHQRPDGSWAAPSDLSRGPRDDPSPLALGTTALGGLALLRAARAGADEHGEALRGGAERALASLADFAARLRARSERAPEVLMDYTVWSHPCALLLAAECGGPVAAEAVRTLASDALEELTRKRKKDGGWSYYLSGTVAGSSTPYEISMSFTTALVLEALCAAQAFGLDTEELRAGAADSLAGMRRADGAFGYLREHTSGAMTGGTPGDAAGRGPACALALVHAERADLAELRARLALFFVHLPALEHEAGKVLMHCGPEAQGSHYVLFDYWRAAEAVAELPPEERPPHRARLRAALLATRNADGSFVDNPMIGRAAGTAMALLALEALARDE